MVAGPGSPADADPGPDMGRHGRDVATVQEDPPAIGAQVAADEVEHRGLARPVRADDARSSPRLQVEGQVIGDDDLSERLRDPLELEERHQGRRLAGRVSRRSGASVPPTGISGWSLLLTMTRSYGNARALPPLTADERGLGDVRKRGVGGPVNLAHDRVQGRGLDRVADRRLVVDVPAPLEGVGGDLEDGMRKAERLSPLLAGRGRVGVGQFLGRLAVRDDVNGWLGLPPDLARETVADGRSERIDRGREEQRLAHRGDLGGEALLLRLGPEVREVGRDRARPSGPPPRPS